jgi:glutamate synthase domain-containing protein 1
MCGIVGILIRDPALEGELGKLLVPMLDALGERGPDSTGIAIYDRPPPAASPNNEPPWRISLRSSQPAADWDSVRTAVAADTGADIRLHVRTDQAVLTATADIQGLLAACAALAPGVDVLGYGHAVDIVKEVGRAAEVCERYAIADRGGYQAIAHTRMATESAVTALHSHPFSPSSDLCVVHNGSFSNHASVRRRLQADGVHFDSDNDSEVAARFIAGRLAEGDDLEEAMRWLTKELDGFFTLVVSSATAFSVVRDAFACKPAVVAETGRYVAVASEYRALATLPGIEEATVFEPAPEEVYTWSC